MRASVFELIFNSYPHLKFRNENIAEIAAKTIATLIIPPPKYNQALLHIVLTDVSPTCFTGTASTKALGLQGVSKNTRLFWTYTRI